MAHNFLVAKGSRWELGEFIVCLDLYLRVGAVHEHHPEVIKASKIIDRSTGSIALRIANFQYVDPNRTGPGLDGGERDCQPIWDALSNDPAQVAALAAIVAKIGR